MGPSSSMPQPTSSHVFGTGSSFGGSLSFQSCRSFADRGQSNQSSLFNTPTTGLFSGQIKSSTGQSTGFPSVAPSSQPSAEGGVLFGSSPIARSSGLGGSVSKVENDNSVVSESVNVTANAQVNISVRDSSCSNQGTVSRKSRNFSGAFRLTLFSLYLQNGGISRHETLQFLFPLQRMKKTSFTE